MQEAGREARLLASFIVEFLKREERSQADLAKQLGIHQSSVSRAIHRPTRRRGRAHARLVGFMHQGGAAHGSERVQEAFRRVWDGTEEHAAALARIIAACEGLGPVGPGAGNADG